MLAVLCLAVTTSATTQSAVSYSIPAGQLMPYLQDVDTPTQLRIKYRSKPWQVVVTREEQSTCSIGSNTVLTAIRTAKNRQMMACEWSIFSPQTRLVPGWLVHRAHWHGDIRQAHFVANPTYTDTPFLRVQLALPSKKAGYFLNKGNAIHRVGLRLLTLKGPEGSNWRVAFERL